MLTRGQPTVTAQSSHQRRSREPSSTEGQREQGRTNERKPSPQYWVPPSPNPAIPSPTPFVAGIHPHSSSNHHTRNRACCSKHRRPRPTPLPLRLRRTVDFYRRPSYPLSLSLSSSPVVAPSPPRPLSLARSFASRFESASNIKARQPAPQYMYPRPSRPFPSGLFLQRQAASLVLTFSLYL